MDIKRVVSHLLISLLFMSQSCSIFEDCSEPELLREGVEKWIPYEDAQIIRFESVSGIDTLIVGNFSRWIQYSAAKCTHPMERIEATINSSHAFTEPLKLHASHSTLTFYHYRTDIEFHFQYDFETRRAASIPVDATYLESITIGGRKFHNVIIAGCDECELLNEVVLAEDYGIVAYTVGNVRWIRIP